MLHAKTGYEMMMGQLNLNWNKYSSLRGNEIVRHVQTTSDDSLPHKLLIWKPNTTRLPGHSWKHWMDNVKLAVESIENTPTELEHANMYLDRRWQDSERPVDAPLYYDPPDYLNVFVAAVPSPLTESDGQVRTMFCCWVVNQECVTLITDQSYSNFEKKTS